MSHIKSFILIAFSSTLVISGCGKKEVSEPKPTPAPASADNSTTQPDASSKEPVVIPTVDRGASLYKRCRICHTLNQGGATKAGPNLYGIFGAKAGTRDGFRYSKTMSESDVIWNDENLSAYLKNPRTFMPGNAMSFAGIRKDEDIALLIEYMREKTSE